MGYRYLESGLDNVVVENFEPRCLVEGQDGVAIPRVGRLHRVIAAALLAKQGPLSAREVCFLRAELGASASELAAAIGRPPAAWAAVEAGTAVLDGEAERRFRDVAAQGLELSPVRVEPVDPAGADGLIRIDGSDPSHYRLLFGAAAS